MELNPRIERHPMFLPLAGVRIEVDGNDEAVLDILFRMSGAISSAQYQIEMAKLDILTEDLYDLALMLVEKIKRGHEAYYWSGLRYIWTLYSWTTPDVGIGGYTEAPGGPLAGYFHPDFQFIREADSLSGSSGIYRLTRSWIGANRGHFDAEIYSPANIFPTPEP